ncbi:MAG: thioredoxin-disulfide reductase [Candidatus Babeliales bacterium]
MTHDIQQLVIIGSGPSGLTSGIYAARAQLKPIIIEGNAPGGQLMGTTYVENWPGEKSILGPTLMHNMREHARHFGCTFVPGNVSHVDFSRQPYTITTEQGATLKTRAVIIASGATPKKLGIPGEETYWGKGVTTCAVCDGAFYPNKSVIIVGGGDTAMEDASFMEKFTPKITVIQNLDALTASKPMQNRVLSSPNIQLLYNSTLSRIDGNGEHITQATVTNLLTKEEKTVPVDGIFIAIGLKPNTDIFKNYLTLDAYGYIKLNDHTKTSLPGVFVAGDVADYRYRQAITSAGSGCMAALDAERYLNGL